VTVLKAVASRTRSAGGEVGEEPAADEADEAVETDRSLEG
jgi:hypothetical protein